MTATRDGAPPAEPAAEEESGPPSAPADTSPPGLSADEFFHALQEERRRHALRCLLDHMEPVEVDRLAEWVASREHGQDDGGPSAEASQRTYLSLYQCHLPKLDSLDLVDFDQSSETVTLTGRADHFAPYLGAPIPGDEHDDAPDGPPGGGRWPRALVGANALGVGLLALAWFGPVATLAVSFRVAAAAVLAIHTALTAALFIDRGR
ncbi:DUF7344 domain-containing protein [Haloglomus halophilum]|uniref:DUF7344 domain-containing protein n=1 Tax=Haloglomus halophilum TaxID=2962672 RepID=UPI0020CA07FE|nr:hypothetical protein [Haloglomus halophilum]